VVNPRRPLSSAWMVLGGGLAAFGVGRLATGSDVDNVDLTKSVAEVLIGVGVLVYARWLRRRECEAIARGSMAPNEP